MKVKSYISNFFLLGFASVSLLMLASCGGEELPPEPRIEFDEFELHPVPDGSDSATISITFEHGHAEMGLESEEPPPFDEPPYNNNFFIDYFEKIDGSFQQVNRQAGGIANPEKPPIEYHSRFPPITIEGDNKAAQGTLKRTIDPLEPGVSDTIKFEIWIVDRDLNHSNTVESPEIFLSF